MLHWPIYINPMQGHAVNVSEKICLRCNNFLALWVTHTTVQHTSTRMK